MHLAIASGVFDHGGFTRLSTAYQCSLMSKPVMSEHKVELGNKLSHLFVFVPANIYLWLIPVLKCLSQRQMLQADVRPSQFSECYESHRSFYWVLQ